MSMKQKLVTAGVTSDMLDSLVHDAADRVAARVNNEGMSEQVEFLENAGISIETISGELEIDL